MNLPTFLAFGDVYNNYSLITDVLHTISKTPSASEEEFEIKFAVQEKMRKAAARYGRAFQLATFGGLIAFCLKTNHIKSKVVLGILYMYWSSHVYTIGSHLGLLLNSSWAYQQLNMGSDFETGRLTQKFVNRIKEREQKRKENIKVESDSQFQQGFYADLAGTSVKSLFAKSYVANDYFTKNFDKYVKRSPDDSDPHRVFEVETNEDKLRVPYVPDALDCFLTRYIYHNFARWGHRFSLYLGLKQE